MTYELSPHEDFLPILSLTATERSVAYAVAELYGAKTEEALWLAPGGKVATKGAVVLAGSAAVRVRGLLEEAAAGTVFTPGVEAVPVMAELQSQAQAIVGEPVANSEEIPVAPELEYDTSEVIADRILKAGINRMIGALTRRHIDYEPQHLAGAQPIAA